MQTAVWTTLGASYMNTSDTRHLLSSHFSGSFWMFSVEDKHMTESPRREIKEECLTWLKHVLQEKLFVDC